MSARTGSSGRAVRMTAGCAAAVLLAAAGCSGPEAGDAEATAAPGEADDAASAAAASDGRAGRYVLDHEAARIDGTRAPLASYEGSVLLVVNTASRCGLTRQYAGLEELYRAKRDEGLVVLGFPANNFMNQEPGTDDEIAAFCEENYGVTFPMFSKVDVVGDGAHPLFAELTALSSAPSWNFTKYLVNREGEFVRRFDPRTGPADPSLVSAVEAALAGS